MIDPKLFTVERLVSTLLDTSSFGYHNKWWMLVEIIPNYKAPFATWHTPSRCVVRCKAKNEQHDHFLRHSAGPRQGHFWDIYGDDYLTPELALLAILAAPIPPSFIDQNVWKEAVEIDRAAKQEK